MYAECIPFINTTLMYTDCVHTYMYAILAIRNSSVHDVHANISLRTRRYMHENVQFFNF